MGWKGLRPAFVAHEDVALGLAAGLRQGPGRKAAAKAVWLSSREATATAWVADKSARRRRWPPSGL
eukprot:15412901-Alexandrium_andersonii.AAC.1